MILMLNPDPQQHSLLCIVINLLINILCTLNIYVFNNKFLINYGTKSALGAVTFPRAFTGKCVAVACKNRGAAANYPISISSLSLTQLTAASSGDGSKFFYIAIGF